MFGVLSTLPCKGRHRRPSAHLAHTMAATRAGASGSQTDPGQGCGPRTCRGSTWEWPQWPAHSPHPTLPRTKPFSH